MQANKRNFLRRDIPQADVVAAKAMRAAGVGWTTISRRLGYHYETIRRRCDADFDAALRTRYTYEGRPKRGAVYKTMVWKITPEELAERRALIPIDTRDTTGRLLGDPIPGDRRRSAV
jgi:hypothetical protein